MLNRLFLLVDVVARDFCNNVITTGQEIESKAKEMEIEILDIVNGKI